MGPDDVRYGLVPAATCRASTCATSSAWVEIMKWAAPPMVTPGALVHWASNWLVRRMAGWLFSPHSTRLGISILASDARVSWQPYALAQSRMLVAVASIA